MNHISAFFIIILYNLLVRCTQFTSTRVLPLQKIRYTPKKTLTLFPCKNKKFLNKIHRSTKPLHSHPLTLSPSILSPTSSTVLYSYPACSLYIRSDLAPIVCWTIAITIYFSILNSKSYHYEECEVSSIQRPDSFFFNNCLKRM